MNDNVGSCAVQAELDPLNVQIGEVVFPPPHSNWGVSKTSDAVFREMRQAGQYAFKPGIDWHEGYIWGRVEDRDAYAQVLRESRRDSQGEQAGTVCQIAGMVGVLKDQPTYQGLGTDVAFLSGDGQVFLGLKEPPSGLTKDVYPILKWQFKGQFCSGKSYGELLDHLAEIAAAFGIEKVDRQLRLCRLDLCVDVLGLACEQVAEMVDRDEWCSVARAVGTEAKRVKGQRSTETLYLGRKGSACQLRVYNKRAELRAEKNDGKAKGFYALNPEFRDIRGGALTRFEWQLQRDKLEQLGMREAKMLPFVLGRAVWQLMTQFGRFVQRETASRKSRCVDQTWWSELRSGFSEAMTLAGGAVSPKYVVPLDTENQRKQTLGNIATFKGQGGFESWEEAFESLKEMILGDQCKYDAKAVAARQRMLLRNAG